MHLVFLTGEYPMPGTAGHGGVGAFVQTLAHQLVDKGFVVEVVGVYPISQESKEVDKGVTVWRLPRSKAPFARFLGNAWRLNRALWRIHAQLPVDIIEGPELSFAFIDRRFPAKKVIRMHGGHHFFAVTLNKKPAFWRSFQEKRSFGKATHLCAVGQYVADTTRSLLHLQKEITVIPNPVDMTMFYKADLTQRIPFSVVFMGTVCEKKGIYSLMRAMPRVLDQYPRAHLYVVGRDWSGPGCPSYMQFLREQINPQLSNHVSFVGPVAHDQIPVWIEQANVCVLPSFMEAFSIGWLEALAMGTPFVGSKIGPGFEAVQEGVTGLLCDPHDPNDIADKILFCFDHPEAAQEMGRRARADIQNRFEVHALFEKNRAFYQHCLQP